MQKIRTIPTFIALCVLGLMSSCTFIESFKGNPIKDGFVYIPRGANFDQVMDSLSPYLQNPAFFRKLAEEDLYPSTIKSGKYKIVANESSRSLLNRLQDGAQEEVRLQIKNHPTLFHMASAVSKQIDADSISIIQSVMKWANAKDSTLTEETVKQYFIPETYFVYWNMSADQFVERMEKEYKKVWNQKRIDEARALHMTPLEVVTLASIVQLESSDNFDEQQRVAKAYMNRLDKDMRLEADPTSIYAYKLENGFDHKIQRVYYKWTQSANEYNTYRNKGLPPAPICLPYVKAIDAVLNPANHDYIFFVAEPDKPGYHLYTNDYQEHVKNAKKYREWIKARDIK